VSEYIDIENIQSAIVRFLGEATNQPDAACTPAISVG